MEYIQKIKQNKWMVMCIVLSLITVLTIYFSKIESNSEDTIVEDEQYLDYLLKPAPVHSNELEPETIIQDSPLVIIVDVKGAVHFPGVYSLDEKLRVGDAIEMAGGVLEDADTRSINFAKQLTDEMLIYVPLFGEEVIEVVNYEEEPQTDSPKININTADEQILMQLMGIGPQKAKQIISYRETEGPFKEIDDITHVSGIGTKTFDKIKEDIVVE